MSFTGVSRVTELCKNYHAKWDVIHVGNKESEHYYIPTISEVCY